MLIRLTGLLLLWVIAGTAGAENPLAPIDTSSPRATFESFMAVTDETARLYTEYRDAPSPATQDAFLRIEEKASRLLDLSRGPACCADRGRVRHLFAAVGGHCPRGVAGHRGDSRCNR